MAELAVDKKGKIVEMPKPFKAKSINDRCLVKMIPLDTKEDKFVQGSKTILAVDMSKVQMPVAEVISIGEEVKYVKKGDIVFHGAHCGMAIFIEGVEYLSIMEKDIYVIL